MKFKILIFILMTLINGCSNQVLTEKEIENKTPIILEAKNYIENEEWILAEERLKEILIKKPLYSRAHLDLAIIYQQQITNYINSIYHYNRYLELNPLSEKNIFINEQINKLKKQLELSFIKNEKKYPKIQKNIKTNIVHSKIINKPKKNFIKYKVQNGDTLSKISREFYNDPTQYNKIVEANDEIDNPRDIKVGQIIVIPK